MSHAAQSPPPGFDELPIDQQIDYVQTLWDRIAARADQVPVPGWHQDILEERLADYEASPEAGRQWDQIEAELRRELISRP